MFGVWVCVGVAGWICAGCCAAVFVGECLVDGGIGWVIGDRISCGYCCSSSCGCGCSCRLIGSQCRLDNLVDGCIGWVVCR